MHIRTTLPEKYLKQLNLQVSEVNYGYILEIKKYKRHNFKPNKYFVLYMIGFERVTSKE